LSFEQGDTGKQRTVSVRAFPLQPDPNEATPAKKKTDRMKRIRDNVNQFLILLFCLLLNVL